MTQQNPNRPPILVSFAVGLTFFNSFVLLEEFVIDRHGLGEYLPFYRVGNLCVWDAAAAVLIGLLIWRGRARAWV